MPRDKFFSYIMARTKYISMGWWQYLLCTRPTCLVIFLYCCSLKLHQGRHVAPLGRIILILCKLIFALTP